MKLLDWAAGKGEKWDASIVGEPTNPDKLGDMIKIGRRGSLSGIITVNGRQGHAAYPHLADNPARGIVTLVEALMSPLSTRGQRISSPPISRSRRSTSAIRQPTSSRQRQALPSTSASTTPGPPRPSRRRSTIVSTAPQAAARLRPGRKEPIDYDIVWRDRPSHVFLTRDERLIETLSGSVKAVTGRTPGLSTSGGTSDARFIKDYCPVVEFGLVGQTMHMVDERVALADLELLTQIYERFLEDWFG